MSVCSPGRAAGTELAAVTEAVVMEAAMADLLCEVTEVVASKEAELQHFRHFHWSTRR